jgi:hypothetical protein
VFVGGGDLNCNRPICGGGRLLFLLGVPVSGHFLGFRGSDDPTRRGLQNGVFRRNAFPGVLTSMGEPLQLLGRYFTHRGLTSIPGNVLDFKLLVYKGFWPMISGHSRRAGFRAIPIKVPVSLGFLQFRTLFGPPILSRFFTPFFARA